MATAFLDSSLRKLLFPYLEGADHEDPSKPTHWMSSLAAEALGLDPSTSSSSLSSASSSSSSSRSRAARPHGKGSTALYTSSSTHNTATSSSRTCDDLDQMKAVPWASMYLNQYDEGEQSSSDEEDNVFAAAPSTKPWASRQSPQDTVQRRATLPLHFPARRQASSSSSQMLAPTHHALTARADADPVSSTADKPKRIRGLSAPTPLTPAQPLNHVNTSLPVRIPPPRICLQGSAEATSLLPISRRQSRSDRDGWPQEGELTPSSSSSSLVQSGESDGSFYGDAGDDDPESQLAAGIARLKAKRRLEEATQTAHAKTQYEKVSKAEDITIVTTEDVTNEDTDASDLSASRLIADNCGFIETLADIVLELKIRRSGSFRGRATSALDVPSLASDRLHPTGLPRSQSLDALAEGELSQRMGARPKFGPEGVSTPASLSKEVRQWSQGRRSSGSRHTSPLLTSRSPSPTPLPPPANKQGTSAKSLFGAMSLVHALLNQSAAYRYCASIAEGTSEEEEEQKQQSAYLSNDADGEGDSATSPDSDAIDLGTGDIDTTAYSSLWATPVPSRSSSSYNLQLLGDERSAFEQDDWAIPSPARPQYLPSTRVTKASYNATRQGPPSKQRVSPLWAATGEDDFGTDLLDDAGAQRPTYQRSWSSFLGMSV
ncbi:hypothetical protein BCV69DRAFT_280312 [Microstroma glucosiphilum]|uniref:Uncharacterized protein n=1 Tax=Pseudomicrostroma glucosiphilum TaxID=1684307 RepID=A0A316UBZ0_9BASI|nr:hypothetical protein BCV69DRAFT_280312 [Pseudomicrostroma glucosiphilum]PWN22706.1 hypothetical protein BCV69DRAFT_280312 [Pseudomicrostroma glucosiphilum]